MIRRESIDSLFQASYNIRRHAYSLGRERILRRTADRKLCTTAFEARFDRSVSSESITTVNGCDASVSRSILAQMYYEQLPHTL